MNRLFHTIALCCAAAIALTTGVPTARGADTFPSRTARIVVPFPPGGSLDIVAREIAQRLSEAWGHAVIVENKPGAGGNIGADYVAKSAPDGYTVVVGALSTHAVNPTLYPSMPYDAVRDFAPISLIAITPNVLVVAANSPYKSVKDLADAAAAKPGTMAFGSGSVGSAGHLAGELFKVVTHTDITHVPYKGAAPATQALLAGDIAFIFDNLANAQAQVKGGKERALAVTTAQRSPLAPELPTMTEAGYPGFDLSTWFGLMAPRGTPPEIVAKWNTALTRILVAPDMRDKLAAQGAEARPTTPEAFAAFIAAEVPKYAAIIKASGAKAE